MDPSASREALTSDSDGQIATEEQICDEKDDVGSRLRGAHWARTAGGLREAGAETVRAAVPVPTGCAV